ncbi:palmitoyltransferase ZDHHC21-like [Ruditapes philippinarum]|uniref:palmitoyltransferase ZDHHC21-like n=1 Tax=Ruditapes philippinarum TaxID=129788 RepID=UPI00295B5243|nr:palmitoyltransferase ZDHHC21-like [Ruditapes philippinarum]
MAYPIKNPNDPVLQSLKKSLGLDQPRPNSESYPNAVNIPLYGEIQFVRDKDGMLLLSAIVAYWIYGIWSSYYVIIEPHWRDGLIPDWIVYYHFIVAILCLVSLFRASTENPGKVPFVEEKFAQLNSWEPCPTCGKWRPNKSHHCRRCKQCVLRMDHHCPWINNCVGEGNHHLFSLLLFYAFLFSFNTFVFMMLHFWYWPKCSTCDPESFPVKYGIWFSYLSFVMSSAMAVFMFSQFFSQYFNLLLNRTTIDNMKVKSVDDVDYTTLRIRGAINAYSDHCGTRRFYLWPWPCRGRRSTIMTDVCYA